MSQFSYRIPDEFTYHTSSGIDVIVDLTRNQIMMTMPTDDQSIGLTAGKGNDQDLREFIVALEHAQDLIRDQESGRLVFTAEHQAEPAAGPPVFECDEHEHPPGQHHHAVADAPGFGHDYAEHSAQGCPGCLYGRPIYGAPLPF